LLDASAMRLSLLVVVGLANVARADPPGLTQPVSAGEPSYRLQTAGTDLAAIGLGLLGHYQDSSGLTDAALGMYVAGSPIVHALHHDYGRAAASVALRVGVPLLLGGIGAAISSGQCNADCGDVPWAGGLLLGLTIGAVAASAIDIGYLSRGEDPAPLPPADRPSASPASAPQPSVEPRTVRFGVAFAF
jgi:hypothetical protein